MKYLFIIFIIFWQHFLLHRSFPNKSFDAVSSSSLCAFFQVDFQLMEVVRPSRQPIRRSFTPGVSLEYMASPNQLEFFAKINSVQVREKERQRCNVTSLSSLNVWRKLKVRQITIHMYSKRMQRTDPIMKQITCEQLVLMLFAMEDKAPSDLGEKLVLLFASFFRNYVPSLFIT